MCRPTSRLLLIASLVSLQIGWSVPNASAQARSQITPGMPADTTVELPPPAGIASTNDDAIGASDVGLASDVGFACGRYGGCGNMTSHGGPVQHNQKVFTIFWAGNAGYTFPSGYQSTINQFVQDLNGSTYYGIAKQYGDTNGFLSPQLIYGGTWLDTVNAIPFPTSGDPSYAQLLAEVNRAKIANPSWISDQNTYFQVYTPNGFVGSQQYCGFHYFSSLPIGLVLYPWSINGYGCFPGGTYPNGSAIDAAISVSAHEILETATDPTGAGWYYESWDGEIGDLCAWIFGTRASDGSNLTLNGRKYLVQEEWSNAQSACTIGYAGPVQSVSLTADRTAPQPAGTTINWTATAGGGTPPLEYKWWVFDGVTWSVVRDWGVDNTFAWLPAVANPSYQVGVWVRGSGGSGPEANVALPFAIQASVTATLAADRAAPQPPGTTITWTATATGGAAPLQYKWWVFDGVTWNVVRDWGVGNTFAWIPAVGNPNYQVGVWVRSNGASGPEANVAMPFAIQLPVTVTLAADRVAPQPPGTTITWTATATGGGAPLQYKWWIFDGVTWNVARDWAVGNTFAWIPAVGNPNYQVGAWVRSSGASGPEAYVASPFAIIPPPGVTVTMVADRTAPQPAGTTITWTATATGGGAPLQYKWWIFDGVTWNVAREWAAGNTFAWIPAVANPLDQVGVWVRSSGGSGPEALAAVAFAITPPPTATATLAADRTAPQLVGTTITWTATATGGAAPLQYKWWVFDGVTWNVAREWAAGNTFAWVPAVGNSKYQVGVWVRSSGGSGPEALVAAPFAIQ